MPSKEQIEQSIEVISRILGESAFIFVDPLKESDAPGLDEWKANGVSIRFTGHKKGTVSLWAGDEFLLTAAANMLGIDENSDESRAKAVDALKEILNIITGNLLTTCYGTEPIFDLSIPENLPAETLKTEYLPRNAVWFEAEGNPVLFLLKMQE